MKKQEKMQPLTNKAGEVRELTTEDFKKAVAFEALPETLKQKMRGVKKAGRRAQGRRKK